MSSGPNANNNGGYRRHRPAMLMAVDPLSPPLMPNNDQSTVQKMEANSFGEDMNNNNEFSHNSGDFNSYNNKDNSFRNSTDNNSATTTPTASAAAAAAAIKTSNLFIRGLAPNVDQTQLDEMFAPFGTILSSAIMRNIHTGESLGTAFVRFESHEEAKAAMAEISGLRMDGRPVTVQWARKHDSAPVGEARKKIMKLFVRNIPLSCGQAELHELFGQYGPVEAVSVHRDTAPLVERRMERRIAFIIFSAEGAAEKAANSVHNTKPFDSCDGIPLMVKLAEDNYQKSSDRMGGGGNSSRGGRQSSFSMAGSPSGNNNNINSSRSSYGQAPSSNAGYALYAAEPGALCSPFVPLPRSNGPRTPTADASAAAAHHLQHHNNNGNNNSMMMMMPSSPPPVPCYASHRRATYAAGMPAPMYYPRVSQSARSSDSMESTVGGYATTPSASGATPTALKHFTINDNTNINALGIITSPMSVLTAAIPHPTVGSQIRFIAMENTPPMMGASGDSSSASGPQRVRSYRHNPYSLACTTLMLS